MATAWYDSLREQYRPDRVRLLLIAESPPDPHQGDRRFFYAPDLKVDNLYRSVALALYGHDPAFDERDKPAVLQRLQLDGVWLVDAVDEPINALSRRERHAKIESAAPKLVETCLEADPLIGVVICHSVVYAVAAGSLRRAGVRVLHTEPLPFPLGNWRAKFIAGMRSALRSSQWSS